MDNNDDSNIIINDNHTVDATSRFGRGDLIQIKSGADWKTVRIESRYRHKYARNRAKYRFKYLANTSSATVYQDFNKISWREVPVENSIGSLSDDTSAENNVIDNQGSLFYSETELNTP